ncbi:MAG: O-antigen ligase family protein [Parcubacteria group bacterium]|nr:O-antigen ligase family protein [Parcubacteria group bacterium]
MSNILLKLVKFGIGFILFIPLYIGGSFFFPFIFPKIWLFQLVIEIILFFYIILAISDNRYRPKLNLVTYALAALTIILIITGFTGVDAYRSFWGNTERMSGVIAWFHFFAFAMILSGVLKSEREWKNYIGIAVSVSVLQFFYVSAQYLGATWVWMPHSQIGTIGNADLLGSYAIFSAFFALYLWRGLNIDVRHRGIIDVGHQYFWATAFFLNIGTLYFAGSRGAMLGFGAGMLVFMLFNIWQNKKNLKIWGAVIGGLIVIYGAVFMFRDANFVKNNYQLSRITRVSIQDTTVQQRFVEWRIAWDAFKDRPIFGFGPNNYLYLHNAFLNPRVYILQETNFDRAHNAYLDYASMSGILGLAAYMFLIAVLFITFWKRKLWTFTAFAVAYAVQSFFVFDSPASFISLFLAIGFAMYEAGNLKSQIPISKQIPNTKYQIQNTNLNSQTILALSTLYLLLTIFLIWQVSVKPAIANYKFVSAFSGLRNNIMTADEAFKLYKESLKYETLGTTEFRNQYITWLQANLGKFNPENRLEVLDFGINELEKEVKNHPLVFTYLNLGQMYSLKARGIQDFAVRLELFNKAAAAYDKALELSPKRLEVYISYLQLSFDMKKYEQGIEIMKRAAEVVPNYPLSHWYLGLAYIASGVHDKEATVSINKALSLWYGDNVSLENGRLKYDLDKFFKIRRAFAQKQEILGAVNPYIRFKMWPELLLLYLSIEAGDPNDIEIHKSLALVYQNLGLNDKLQEELKIIEQLSSKK